MFTNNVDVAMTRQIRRSIKIARVSPRPYSKLQKRSWRAHVRAKVNPLGASFILRCNLWLIMVLICVQIFTNRISYCVKCSLRSKEHGNKAG